MMYNNYGNWNNPMFTMQQQRPQIAPHYEVIKVHGEAGAKNVIMGPNSEALLLDETAPIVWYAQTDGTGYLQVTPFDITPHKQNVAVNLNDLSERVAKLEEQLSNVQQSNPGVQKQSKRSKQPSTNLESTDTTT